MAFQYYISAPWRVAFSFGKAPEKRVQHPTSWAEDSVRQFPLDHVQRAAGTVQPKEQRGVPISSAVTVCARGEIASRSSGAVTGSIPDERADSNKMASARQQVVCDFFRGHGLAVEVPPLAVPDSEFMRRSRFGQEPFYRPPSKVVDYPQFMIAAGYGYHFSVADERARDSIIWEPTDTGYWFWGDVMDQCPRIGIPQVELAEMIRLPALEEYVIGWCLHQREHGERFDSRTWSWLRTRSKQGGALRASGFCVLHINVCGADELSRAYPTVGGRSVERIAAAR